jgi:hypothetical protein
VQPVQEKAQRAGAKGAKGQNMSYIAITKESTRRTFIIGTEGPCNWHDVRAFAGAILGCDPAYLDCIDTAETRPDAILRWTGSDAGSHPDRHLEAKMRVEKYGETFGEWRPVREIEAPAWLKETAPSVPPRTNGKKGRTRG